MTRFTVKEIQSLEKPHQKPQLTTRIGRLVERASYADVLLVSVLVLLLAALYFSAGWQGHTLSSGGDEYQANYPEALYFSIVTFTSLGYGDFAPVGFGRVVASAVVFCGLATIALVIGKVASERSQTSLLLLHRSDVEKRLSGHSEAFAERRRDAHKLAKASDVAGLEELTRSLVDGHQSLKRYIVFHANQSTALAFGNDGALGSFAKELMNVQECCIELHKEASRLQSPDIAQSTRILAYRLHWTVSFMKTKHDEAGSATSYTEAVLKAFYQRETEVSRFSKTSGRIIKRMQTNLDALEKWRSSEITIDTLNDVFNRTPEGPIVSWPKDLHKTIAKDLEESNNRVSRHFDKLIESGKLPKVGPAAAQSGRY